jgi:hypothetical protein
MSTSHNAFLPPDLRALIEADRNQPGPPEEVRQKVARRVDRALGLGGAMLIPVPALGKVSVPPSAGSVAAPAAVGVAAWKIAIGVAVVALAGAGGFTLAARRAPASATREPATMAIGRSAGNVSAGLGAVGVAPEAKSAATPSTVENSAPSILLDLDADPASINAPAPTTAAAAKASSPEHARPARPTDRLADERKLLDRARSALARRDAGDALAAIRAHEKAFGRGQLVEEREGMRVQALVVAHDFGSARAAGERFRKAYPHSVFQPVVDRALEIAR